MSILIPSVKKPIFNLPPGEYQGTQSLEIAKGNATDKIYYTMDGSGPTTTSPEYSVPISLQPGEITVKLLEVNDNGVQGQVLEGKYIIKIDAKNVFLQNI